MSATVDVRLRNLEGADKDRLLGWRNRADVRRWMYTDHLISPAEHERWFTGALQDPNRRYWMVELEGRPVGLASVEIAAVHRRATWGWYLGEPDARGRGVGAYAQYCGIETVFDELGLNKLWSEVLADNEGAWRLHEAFGFKREALFRAHVWKGGMAHDVVGLGLLADDWSGLREQSRRRLLARGLPV
jgi:UDP-4-amino-4,6-dideoxy-N-acetyl-beta-L-altrosamine N-acetyltransferase